MFVSYLLIQWFNTNKFKKLFHSSSEFNKKLPKEINVLEYDSYTVEPTWLAIENGAFFQANEKGVKRGNYTQRGTSRREK